jgi:hypothetical protein
VLSAGILLSNNSIHIIIHISETPVFPQLL